MAATKASTAKAAATKAATLLEATEISRGLWYGDPGKGKTFDIAHMAKLGKVIYIDAERRLKKGPLVRAGVPIGNIEPFIDVSYKSLIQLAMDITERLADGEDIVGLCWDSGTETHRIFLEGLVDSAVIKAANQGKERDPWSTYREDYGDMTEQMRRVLRRFRDLPIHLAIAALAKREDDEEGKVRVSPAFTPAVLRDVMGYMDVVFHKRMELVEGKEEYSGLSKPIGRFEAKDSYGVFPRVLVDPTFDRVLKYIEGDLTGDKDPIQIEARAARLRQQQDAPTETASAPAEADTE